MIQHISAVTLAVRAMPEAITFYTQLGFTLVYGSPHAQFSTLQAGDALVNLTLAPNFRPTWWGRTIFRVDDVETLYHTAVAQGLTPSALQQGSWGERYFHLTDPNGHELSFAQLLPATATQESLLGVKDTRCPFRKSCASMFWARQGVNSWAGSPHVALSLLYEGY